MQSADSPYRFTLRLWMEEMGEGHSEWRGQVQHVMSRESYYFRDWRSLVALLQELLPYRTTDEEGQ
jgi:hypothetical protein